MDCFEVYEEAKRIGESLKERGQVAIGDELLRGIVGSTSGEALTNIWVAALDIRKQKGVPPEFAKRLRTLQRTIKKLLRPTPFQDLMSWFKS